MIHKMSLMNTLRRMRPIGIGLFLALLSLTALPLTALADEPEPYDARLLGYPSPPNVQLEGGSTALTWLLLVVLGVLTIAVLFKDAKRTHLD
jgi:hypothetical protein